MTFSAPTLCSPFPRPALCSRAAALCHLFRRALHMHCPRAPRRRLRTLFHQTRRREARRRGRPSHHRGRARWCRASPSHATVTRHPVGQPPARCAAFPSDDGVTKPSGVVGVWCVAASIVGRCHRGGGTPPRDGRPDHECRHGRRRGRQEPPPRDASRPRERRLGCPI